MNRLSKCALAALMATTTVLTAHAQEDYSKSYNYQMAQEYFQAQDYEKAAYSVMSELAQHPRNAGAHILKGDLYDLLGTYDEAGECYARAMMVSEDDKMQTVAYGTAVTRYANILAGKLGRNAEAETLIDNAAKRLGTVNMMLWQGWIADRVGNGDKAAKAYRSAIKANGKTKEFTDDVLYGDYLIPSLLTAGKLTEAGKAIAEAEKICPDGLEWKLSKVRYLDLKGEDEAAIDLSLETAFRVPEGAPYAIINSRSQNGPAWAMRLVDIAFKGYDLVMSKLEKFAKEKDAAEATLWTAMSIAQRLRRSDDYLRLMKELQPDGMDSDPDVAQAYSDIFANNRVLEVTDNIIANAEREGDTEHANYYRASFKATHMARIGDLDGAESLLNSIAAADPSNIYAYHMHSYLLTIYTRRYAEAAAYADTALYLTGKETAAGATMTYLRMINNHRLGNKEKAEADAKALIAYESRGNKTTDNPNTRLMHAKTAHDKYGFSCSAYAILGQREKALEAIRACLEPDVDLDQFPTYEKYIEAAERYSLLGMADETLTYLGKALEAGYRDFIFIEMSPTFDIVRERADFAELVDTYRTRYRQEIEAMNN